MSDLRNTLAEMLAVCEENEQLKQTLKQLKQQLKDSEQRKQTIDPSVIRIDQVMAELANNMDAAGEPVNSLVKASISVLEAAKTLLEACRHKVS